MRPNPVKKIQIPRGAAFKHRHCQYLACDFRGGNGGQCDRQWIDWPEPGGARYWTPLFAMSLFEVADNLNQGIHTRTTTIPRDVYPFIPSEGGLSGLET